MKKLPFMKMPFGGNLGLMNCILAGILFAAPVQASEGYGALFGTDDAVTWHSWGPETQAKVLEAQKPVFFSISHEFNNLSRSMVSESFQNPEVAGILESGFTVVVVDRNEHSALASYFQAILQGTAQVTGFPLTVFTTPDLHWIDGGGYFPPSDTWGGQGFPNLLRTVHDSWNQDQEQVILAAEQKLKTHDAILGSASATSATLDASILDALIHNLRDVHDADFGGFIVGPKTPDFVKIGLLRSPAVQSREQAEAATSMAMATQNAVLSNSIHDVVRGGFFSSSTDDLWTVPQFLKTASDQCKAIEFLVEHEPSRVRLLERVVRCLLHDFQREDGWFVDSVVIAEAEQAELEQAMLGKAHLWSYDELQSLLGAEAFELLLQWIQVEPSGNVPGEQDPEGIFQNMNLLRLKNPLTGDLPEALVHALDVLREARSETTQVLREGAPGLTTNARMVSALVSASSVLGDAYLKQASAHADRLWQQCVDTESQRLRPIVQRDSAQRAADLASVEYAVVIRALLDLAEAAGESVFLDRAVALQGVFEQYYTNDGGLSFVTSSDAEVFPLQLYAIWEEADLSAVALQIRNLDTLARLTGDASYTDRKEKILSQLPDAVGYAPEHFPYLLTVLFSNAL